MEYKHSVHNDEVKLEIRDGTGAVIIKLKFSSNDKQQWKQIFSIAKKYGYDVYSLFNNEWV